LLVAKVIKNKAVSQVGQVFDARLYAPVSFALTHIYYNMDGNI